MTPRAQHQKHIPAVGNLGNELVCNFTQLLSDHVFVSFFRASQMPKKIR